MTVYNPQVRSFRQSTRGIPAHYRAQVGRIFKDLALERGIGRVSGGRWAWNAKSREAMADAIFSVENELESRKGGQPDHPAVVAMRAARNRLYEDLGWGR